MNNKFRLFSLVLSTLVLVVVLGFVSCKKKDKNANENPWEDPWSPEPNSGGVLPPIVFPTINDSVTMVDSLLYEAVTAHINIYIGENPPAIYGQFLSHPHILIHSTFSQDTIGSQYSDRYIAFERNGDKVNFYGKQGDYEEVYRDLYVIGEGENFTCYYITEGYPDGLYAKQSTIFSGNWNETLGGLGDFKVAVILLETSGNPNLAPKNSFRILGDGDGLAENDPWLFGKGGDFGTREMSDEAAFRMFRIK